LLCVVVASGSALRAAYRTVLMVRSLRSLTPRRPRHAGAVTDLLGDPTVLRCADFARAESLGPAGTAGTCAGIVALELPLPWPREITDHPEIARIAGDLAAAGVRLQALVPHPARSPELRRMFTFVRPPGPFRAYVAAEWAVPAADAASALGALAAAVSAGGTVVGGLPARRVADGDGAGRQVLVCTHGVRDTCCGAQGTRLAAALPGLGAGVRSWRTSHTGGHRFAPTALVLPEGTAWAYLDLDTLVGVVDRTLDPRVALGHYRGCTGLDGPEVQAADGAALGAAGWAWLDHARAGTVVERDGATARVRLEGTAPDGTRTDFEAEVEAVRMMPVPDCGRPVAEAKKSAPELVVRRLDAV
jgi:hypothetical protein